MILRMSVPLPGLLRRWRQRRRAILFVALVAFGLAQALAIAHTARHARDDSPTLPGSAHTQLCTDCASLLPLLVVAGAAGVTLAIRRLAGTSILAAAASRPALAPVHRAFRSRAPPSPRR